MSPVDRKALQDWYRTSMQERVRQLEELRPGLRRRDLAVMAQARDLGHGLKGSGGSFGFPAVTEAGAMVADSPDDALARRTEGLIALLRHVAWPDDVEKHKDYAWLAWAAGVTPPSGSDGETSWRLIAERAGLSEDELAGLAADFYGLPTGVPLTPTPQALHLVPEAVVRIHALLPLSEDDLRIRVATSNAANLAAVAQLTQLTGRQPEFVLVPPPTLAALVASVLARAAPAPVARPRAVSPGAGPPTVLLVDDDASSRVVARAVLERKEYRVIEAATGEAALEKLRENPETLLAVVDLEMPGMGGRALIRTLRASAETAGLPLMVLTSSDCVNMEAELIEDGADDYVRKPLDPRVFLARVASTLRRTAG